jgi:hypothetical protein
MEPFPGYALSQTIVKILVEARDQSFLRLLKRLRSIEMTHITEHQTDTMILMETKRRVAEACLHVSITKRLTFKSCRRYFDRLCALGFSSPGREFTYSLILARYAKRCGCNASGARLIEPFVRRWKATGKPLDGFSIKMMMAAAELLSELQSSE